MLCIHRLYNDMQQALAATSSVLLLSPSLSRPYLLALYRLTLERDAQLRQSALLHAHQVDSARMAYEQERNKVEDEARNSKKAVREKLLAAVEDRRRRLREDKEGGEGMSGEGADMGWAHVRGTGRTHSRSHSSPQTSSLTPRRGPMRRGSCETRGAARRSVTLTAMPDWLRAWPCLRPTGWALQTAPP